MRKRKVVVTGMGLVSCLGNDPDIFYQKLLQGESGISVLPEEVCRDVYAKVGGVVTDFNLEEVIDRKRARRVDRFIAFAIWAGKKAVFSAGLPLEGSGIDRARAGVILGSGVGGMTTLFDNSKVLLERGGRKVSPFLIPHILTDTGGALLAEEFGFMGPNYSMSTACATSTYSIISAAKHITSGEADIMVCGGSEAPLSPIGVAGFCAMKALSGYIENPSIASRPFDKNRDGFVMSEGGAALVLESEEFALQRGATILAEYIGGAVSCDAYHMTEPRPDGWGVALCIEKALKEAGITPEQISYINTHATSTILGDVAELRALERVFMRPQNIAINATKSMTGHALGAAGGLEAIATIQAIRTGLIHPTINLTDPEEVVFDMPTEKKKVDIEYALSNSFGFGGHNATIILAPYG